MDQADPIEILSEQFSMSRVTVDHLIFSASVLDGALDGSDHGLPANVDSLPTCTGAHILPSPELAAARRAGGDGIIGVAIGQDEADRPAIWALKGDLDVTDGNVGHGAHLQETSDG